MAKDLEREVLLKKLAKELELSDIGELARMVMEKTDDQAYTAMHRCADMKLFQIIMVRTDDDSISKVVEQCQMGIDWAMGIKEDHHE